MNKLNILERGGTLAFVALGMLGVMAGYSLWKWNEVASAMLIQSFTMVALETIRNFNKNVDEVIDDKEPKA
jgi:predicted methyltransferase